jgi:hypothetical protein
MHLHTASAYAKFCLQAMSEVGSHLLVQLILIVQIHQPHEAQDPAHSHDLAGLIGRGVACASCEEGDLISLDAAAAAADPVQAIHHCWNVQKHRQGRDKVDQPVEPFMQLRQLIRICV